MSILLTSLISCENDGDSANNIETEHAATKQKLIGKWRLLSSTIEGVALGTKDFFISTRNQQQLYNADNTYELIFYKA